MSDSDPALHDDYLGSRQSALGLLLAVFGAGILVTLMVVTPQMLGEPGGARWKPWILLLGGWSVVSVGLGLHLRRNAASLTTIMVAGLWLVPALGTGIWVIFQ
jgi:hypothetical protein